MLWVLIRIAFNEYPQHVFMENLSVLPWYFWNTGEKDVELPSQDESDSASTSIC